LEEAQQILARFAGHARCFPRISNQRMNAYLREIATIKGITKHLTTHVARHTFATLMLERGLPLETISHILGHSSTNTTQIYARLLQSKITNDLNRLGIYNL
jgi:integrase/recombinase XerD